MGQTAGNLGRQNMTRNKRMLARGERTEMN
jgi:hypothetical protein